MRPGVFVLPRDALRHGNELYVVDAEGKINFRSIELLRTERNHIVVGEGLKAGDRVCTSPLEAAIDGMLVRVADAPQAALAEALSATPPPAAATDSGATIQ
jgi:hypothetical protein